FPDGTTQTNITTQVVYTSNLTTSNGCDSIVETTVNVNPTYFNQETASVCSGGSYTFPDGTTQTNITTQVVYTSNLTTTNGCDSIIETTVDISPQNSINLFSNSPVCFGDNIILSATSSGNGVVTWYSDNLGNNVIGSGNSLTIPAGSIGTFTYYANETGGCSSPIDSIQVVIGGVQASINATPSTGSTPLNVFFGNNSTTGMGINYLWNFGNGNSDTIFEPTQTYSSNGTYLVTLIVTDGVCSDTTSITITANGISTILIPNVFTPNADGHNDVFRVDGENLMNVKAEIFNRWGLKLYSWNAINGSWDGRTNSGVECPDGTYYFIIEAIGIDGVEYLEKGSFSLIR
ncbi:MAG: gliding motility-associated C-terminal domain-containing protein, partial [Flavobacteriales bacterium]|nr:gliding motility-associated C-terminal domain-containing protein [Flavobacteriales bacterium]